MTVSGILFLGIEIGHASDEIGNRDITSDENCMPYEESIIGVVAKIYVNPERVFVEDNSYYLSLAENKCVEISPIECDAEGYFFLMSSQNLANLMSESSVFQHLLVRGVDRQCPLCGTPGYYAGSCQNPKCVGKENKRKHEEDRKKKKEDYAKKKKGK